MSALLSKAASAWARRPCHNRRDPAASWHGRPGRANGVHRRIPGISKWLPFPLCVCLACLAGAQPAPTLDPLAPIALKSGESIDVPFRGHHLSKVDSIAVTGPGGFTAKFITTEKRADDSLTVRMTAAPDAMPGDRTIQLLGPSGVTPPVRISISQYGVIRTYEKELPLPSTLCGVVNTAGQIDRFRFHASRASE